MRRQRRVRLLYYCVASAILAVFIAAVSLSPFALRRIDHLGEVDWIKLSYVGQTYGAISAILAAIALVGVAASISLQVRDARYNRWAEIRARHYDLMKMALDDPMYMNAFSWPEKAYKTRQLGAYINLLLSLWETQWEFGDIQESQLRQHLAGTLSTPAGRNYWATAGAVRTKYDSMTRQQRDFNRIAQDVYSDVTAPGYRQSSAPVEQNNSSGYPMIAGTVIVTAAAAWAVIRRLRDRSPS